MRVKRIGSTTSGLILIAAGLAFLASSVLNSTTVLEWTLKLWPAVLICLGVEILLAQRKTENVERKYDFLSVILSLFCIIFVLACEIARLELYANGILP